MITDCFFIFDTFSKRYIKLKKLIIYKFFFLR